MRKELSFGRVACSDTKRVNLVTLELELDISDPNKPVFSASGNIWNSSLTDIYMGGQCLDTIWDEYGTQLYNPTLYKKVLGLWKRNHLNDLNAGCEHQRMAGWQNDMVGIPCPTCGYRYGSAWLYRPISEEDLQEIRELLKQ